jgi:hypothetical protein
MLVRLVDVFLLAVLEVIVVMVGLRLNMTGSDKLEGNGTGVAFEYGLLSICSLHDGDVTTEDSQLDER